MSDVLRARDQDIHGCGVRAVDGVCLDGPDRKISVLIEVNILDDLLLAALLGKYNSEL